jgi:putative ABC transport system permease protein
LLTGVLFGSAPALAASGMSLSESLKEGGRGSTDSRRLHGARGLLVVFEVAVTLTLLVSGGLFVQSLARLQRVGLGFNTENVLTFGVDAPTESIGSGPDAGPKQFADFYRRVEERLKSLPGVTSVSVTSSLPLSGDASSTGLAVEGRARETGKTPMGVIHSVGVDYFRALGVSVRRGREFDARDDLSGPPVLIVNETLARRLFPNEDPLGKRIEPSFSTVGNGGMREIVGVVADTRHTGPRDEPTLEIYFPQAQMPMDSMSVVIRASGDPHNLANATREAMRSLNKDAVVYQYRTLDEYFVRTIAAPRFNTFLIGLFSVVALLITVVGLYGVISCAVSQNIHEFGIRMALGAGTGDILRLVLRQGMALTSAGIGLGLLGAFAVTRWLADLLYGVSATDPITFGGIALLLAAVALLACYAPARRATKVDPMIALRAE